MLLDDLLILPLFSVDFICLVMFTDIFGISSKFEFEWTRQRTTFTMKSIDHAQQGERERERTEDTIKTSKNNVWLRNSMRCH